MKRLAPFGIVLALSLVALVYYGCGTSDDTVSSAPDYGSVTDAAKEAKVLICHVPPGNPENAHVISVSANALAAHLDHGDCVAPEGAVAGDDCDCEEGPGPDPACAGAACGTFIPCDDPDGTCTAPVCATTAEGGGVCLEGTTPCSGLLPCTASSDCPPGYVCAVETCCGTPVCIPPEAFCNPSGEEVVFTPTYRVTKTARPTPVGPTIATP